MECKRLHLDVITAASSVSVSFLCDSTEEIYISIAAFSTRLFDKEQWEYIPCFEYKKRVVYSCKKRFYCIGSLTDCSREDYKPSM